MKVKMMINGEEIKGSGPFGFNTFDKKKDWPAFIKEIGKDELSQKLSVLIYNCITGDTEYANTMDEIAKIYTEFILKEIHKTKAESLLAVDETLTSGDNIDDFGSTEELGNKKG